MFYYREAVQNLSPDTPQCELPLMLAMKTSQLILPSGSLLLCKLKASEQPSSPRPSFWHLLPSSWSELGTDKRHIPAQQSRSPAHTLHLYVREEEREEICSWAFLDPACNVLSARRGYLCNVSHSLLSHWICWHTVSGSRLWSTRSILRFCAAVDMATILVD